jgi:hypothetical protein
MLDDDSLFVNLNYLVADAKNLVFEWDDGYHFCKKDFQNEGSFCSTDCFYYLMRLDVLGCCDS